VWPPSFYINPNVSAILEISLQIIFRKLRKYRVIHKSLRDFRPLRYSSRDGHVEGEHVNRGRDTPSFCPTLQVLDIILSAVSVLVVAQPISEVPERLVNYPVLSSKFSEPLQMIQN